MQSKQFINSWITCEGYCKENDGNMNKKTENDLKKTYIKLLYCSRSPGVKFKFPFEFVSYNHMMTVAIRATKME